MPAPYPGGEVMYPIGEQFEAVFRLHLTPWRPTQGPSPGTVSPEDDPRGSTPDAK